MCREPVSLYGERQPNQRTQVRLPTRNLTVWLTEGTFITSLSRLKVIPSSPHWLVKRKTLGISGPALSLHRSRFSGLPLVLPWWTDTPTHNRITQSITRRVRTVATRSSHLPSFIVTSLHLSKGYENCTDNFTLQPLHSPLPDQMEMRLFFLFEGLLWAGAEWIWIHYFTFHQAFSNWKKGYIFFPAVFQLFVCRYSLTGGVTDASI